MIRLYGLRIWIEQSYKQLKTALGWADYQVRSDRAMRRHWQLVWCAFSFCWWAESHPPEAKPDSTLITGSEPPTMAAEALGCPASTAQSQPRKKKEPPREPCRLMLAWPEALRRVRSWLEPYLRLRRYWRAWSRQPPPTRLNALLAWLGEGRPLELYVS